MDWIQPVYDIILLCVNALICSFIFKCRFSRPVCLVVFLVPAVLLELVICFSLPSVMLVSITHLIKEFLLLPLVIIAFKGNFLRKIFVSFAAITIAAFFTSIAAFGAQLVFAAGLEFYLLRYFFEWGILGAYFFLFLRFGRNFVDDLFASAGRFNWILYISCVVLSWFSIRGNAWPDMFQQENFNDVVKYLVHLFIGFGNLLIVFTAITSAGKKVKADYELHLAREIIASGIDYYKRLDRLLQEIRILRHDYKYQIGIIEELAKISKAKYIREFLSTTHTYYNQTEPVVYCENLVINALLANYAERFEKNNICFHVKAVLPAEIPHVDTQLNSLDNYEICIVLGNLLENSWEGTITVPEAQRRVSLYIHLMDGKLLIEEKNTFDGKIMADKEHFWHFNIPRSRKGMAGGYGLRSIMAVCNRHAGEYLPEWTDTEYTVHILLNL
jgi:hypothetical protein